MIDMDKVIGRFEYNIICDSETYNTVEIPIDEATEILELLKEQGARVLSMSEILELEKAEAPCVWLEVKEITNRYWFEGWAEPVYYDETETELYGFGVDYPVEAKLRDYGVEYRCWNHEPTEAQMKAVPWDE